MTIGIFSFAEVPPSLAPANHGGQNTTSSTVEEERQHRVLEPIVVDRSRMIIIFDWDDTLFPTTALNDQGLNPGSLEGVRFAPFNKAWDESVSRLQSGVARLLKTALDLAQDRGQVYIVTNSCEGWVEACTERYFPEAFPFLARVRVVSARKHFSDHQIHKQQPLTTTFTAEDGLRWKAFTFASLAAEAAQTEVGDVRMRGHEDGDCDLADEAPAPLPSNVISVGDSPIDHSAARLLHRFLPKSKEQSLVKTVRLMANPTLDQLGSQHRCLLSSLENIVNHPSSANLWMARRGTEEEESADEDHPAFAATMPDIARSTAQMLQAKKEAAEAAAAKTAPTGATTVVSSVLSTLADSAPKPPARGADQDTSSSMMRCRRRRQKPQRRSSANEAALKENLKRRAGRCLMTALKGRGLFFHRLRVGSHTTSPVALQRGRSFWIAKRGRRAITMVDAQTTASVGMQAQ